MPSSDNMKPAGELNGPFNTLSAYLQSAREEERKSVAREIHDELGQALTTMKLELALLREEIIHDAVAAGERTQSLQREVDEILQAVKRIITKLRPGLLDDLGLTAAIEWQANEFQRLTGVVCDVAAEPDELSLDPQISTAVFRIFQETLTNITRHAGATRVSVQLRNVENSLELCVRDNGRGITPEEIDNPKAFGLLGIRERARYGQGTVTISGGEGIGTTVTVRFPAPAGGRK